MVDYNVNVNPLLAQYNNTNSGSVPLIPSDKLAEIRGSGLFNPAPLYPQSTNRGNAFSNIDYNHLIIQYKKMKLPKKKEY